MRTVLSPAIVPRGSGHSSSSMPAATGCAAPLAEQDEHVFGLAHLQAKAREHLGHGGEGVVEVGVRVHAVGLGEGVAFGALQELELADVARKGGLSDVDAPPGELATQIILIGHGDGQQQFADGAVAEGLQGRK